ncbi:MFS general substrate transporter [Gonapodya prolifera JEL478]|uniref:MFS general substrate transporter n=1 Tax=Gonapodya prolifera (strain JEL478) TaxID=1344416 RepID=A0A139AWZ3_GONPJ|nr:MFS general substrate transporter [Gonapodya prolifera JEL478]|eukprot:KXS21262.1 MFS general substrate transporter [Gonapodya prolifera JEL478]
MEALDALKEKASDTALAVEMGGQTSFSKEEENAVIRKVDLRLMPWLLVLYFFSQLDRGNLANAVIMNTEDQKSTMLFQLGASGDDYNWAVTVFFFGYVGFEIPSNLLMSKFTPRLWLSRICVTWGLCAALMAATFNPASLMACRFFLGLSEAGLAPGLVLLLRYWYKQYEISSRFATWYAASGIATGFGGLIAYGVANMNGVGGLAGWRWLFILEGVPTILAGILNMWLLPDYPQTCKWLSDREKEILISRLPPTAPSMHQKKIQHSEIIEAFSDYKVWINMLTGTCQVTMLYASAYFTPSVIRSMGFVSTQAQLLSVALGVLTSFWTVVINFSSDYFQEKGWHLIGSAVPGIICYALLATIQTSLTPYQRYGLLFLGTTVSSGVPIVLTWRAVLIGGTTKTAVVTAALGAAANIGGAIGGQIYRANDAPLYLTGHKILCALLCAEVVFGFAHWYVSRDDEKRVRAERAEQDARQKALNESTKPLTTDA